jgi:hypothetical protein
MNANALIQREIWVVFGNIQNRLCSTKALPLECRVGAQWHSSNAIILRWPRRWPSKDATEALGLSPFEARRFRA